MSAGSYSEDYRGESSLVSSSFTSGLSAFNCGCVTMISASVLTWSLLFSVCLLFYCPKYGSSSMGLGFAWRYLGWSHHKIFSFNYIYEDPFSQTLSHSQSDYTDIDESFERLSFNTLYHPSNLMVFFDELWLTVNLWQNKHGFEWLPASVLSSLKAVLRVLCQKVHS